MTIKIVRIALYAILGIWGMLSLALLAAEDNAGVPLELSDFVFLKIMGAASLLLCVLCGKYLMRCGLLPFKSDNR